MEIQRIEQKTNDIAEMISRFKLKVQDIWIYVMVIIIIAVHIIEKYYPQFSKEKVTCWAGAGIIGSILLIPIITKIENFFRAISLYSHMTNEDNAVYTSMHEAAHTLLIELIYPKGNIHTKTSKGILGSLDVAKYNCPGITLPNVFRVDVYVKSNNCSPAEVYFNYLKIALAGIIAENMPFEENELIDLLIENVKSADINEQDDYSIAKMCAIKIAVYTGEPIESVLTEAILFDRDILKVSEVVLVKLYKLILKNNKLDGKKVTSIVKRYYKGPKIGYSKTSRFVYIRLLLWYLIKASFPVGLMIEVYSGVKKTIKVGIKDFREFFKQVKNDPQILRSKRFRNKVCLLIAIYAIMALIMYLEKKYLSY